MPRKTKPIDHGTAKGYVMHRRREERPCVACLQAWADYYTEYRAKKAGMKTRGRNAS